MGHVERLKEVRAWAKSGPVEFEMLEWVKVSYDANKNVCGTTMCIAGYGAMRAEPARFHKTITIGDTDWYLLNANTRVISVLESVSDETPEYGYVQSIAREWYGLTYGEASDLFHSGAYWEEELDLLIERYSE